MVCSLDFYRTEVVKHQPSPSQFDFVRISNRRWNKSGLVRYESIEIIILLLLNWLCGFWGSLADFKIIRIFVVLADPRWSCCLPSRWWKIVVQTNKLLYWFATFEGHKFTDFTVSVKGREMNFTIKCYVQCVVVVGCSCTCFNLSVSFGWCLQAWKKKLQS